jgi:superfamily I DNA/RNA helicase
MTDQVAAIHEAFRAGLSVTVEAGAGCGKTTLIQTGEHLLPDSTLFLAFNKAIADELGKRMPSRQDNCKTFHALTLRNLTQRMGKLKVDAYKYSRQAERDYGVDRETANIVSQIVSNFQLGVGPVMVDHESWTGDYIYKSLSEHFKFDLDVDPVSLILCTEWAGELLRKSAKNLKELSFDDMLFFCAYFARVKKWKLKDYDCVVVDEAQDVSPIRMHLLTLLSDRLIQVGDRRQAIYAFAGAMTNAMDEMSNRFNCFSYPLSVTWRCSKAIIAEASTVVGTFLQARPDADEGQVSTVFESSFINNVLDKDTMVVCRMNAPLIAMALKLFRQRTPFNLMSDFPLRLEKKVKKIAKGCSGMASFKTALADYYGPKIEAAAEQKNLASRIQDEWDTILTVAELCRDPQEIASTLISLSQSKHGVILATGHKAKGLEADHIFILRPDLCPAPWVDQDADPEGYQQELNLLYVMITRAKHNLVYVAKG